MKKEISKEAKNGLDWARLEVERLLAQGVKPQRALEHVGINGWEDTYFFLEYLRNFGHKTLLKKLI